MAKPVIKKNCKGEITAASVAPEYSGRAKSTTVVCTTPLKNIVETLKSDPGFSSLVDAIEKAGLTKALETDDNFTVLAPVNEAFDAITEQLKTATIDELVSILLYHVIPQKLNYLDFTDEGEYATLNNNAPILGVAIDGRNNAFVEYNDGEKSEFIQTDIQASNGVIHSIDAVLLPKIMNTTTPKNLIETLTKKGFTALVDAIKAVGLTDALSKPENVFTVFAPTNEAFTAVAQEVAQLTATQIFDILTYHLLVGKLTWQNFDSEVYYPTLNTNAFDLSIEWDDADQPSVIYNNDQEAKIVEGGIEASNGIIHAIDTVMLPRLLSIGAIVEQREDLSTLKDALIKADLLEKLKQPANFTLLAPDNVAFGKINFDDLQALLNDEETLLDTLLYHITVDIDADDLVNGQKLKTNQGNKIVVSVIGEGTDKVIEFNDAILLEQDIEASNGIVQIISSVLDPNTNEIKAGETQEIDVDSDGDNDIKIKRINNTESYIIEILTQPCERYVCARISHDGKDDGTIDITELANGEVKIDVNGNVYLCSLIPDICETPEDTLPANDDETVTGNDTGFGTPIETLPGNDTVTGGNDTITSDTTTGNDTVPGDTVIGNDTVPSDTIVGNDTVPSTEVCEEIVVTLNYDETVATLRGLLKNITFSTESDFKGTVNERCICRLPKKGTIVAPEAIARMVADKNSTWLQFAGIANSLPFTIWRYPRNRKDKKGQSNTEYMIVLFHEEGTIRISIRAVET